MVVGLLFLTAIIGIGIVAVWSIKNDRVPLGGKTAGLLAMADKTSLERNTKGGQQRRTGGTVK